MAGVESRDFDSPDETRTPDKTQVDVVRTGAATAARRLSSRGGAGRNVSSPSPEPRVARLAMSAQAYVIESGHDAGVVGDERFVGFEFESRSAEEYAKG